MSEIQAITMPKWGMEMSEGAVVVWLVEEGAEISAGDEIVEIETTKITNVYESPASGILRRVVVGPGKTVPVKTLLAVVAPSDVSDADIDAFVAEFAVDDVADEGDEETGTLSLTIDTEAGALHYIVSGEDPGVPALLLHGFGGDCNSWLFNQPVLAAGRNVYALDLPGHGASAKDVGPGDIAALAQAVGAFVDALGLDKVHLAGHSMGGAVALKLALERPDLAASLSLISPVGLGPDINMDFIDGFIAADRRKEMKAVLLDLFFDSNAVNRDMVNNVLKSKRIDGVVEALATIAGAVFSDGAQTLLLRDRLAEVSAPVQVIWGVDDAILPARHADGLPGEVSVQILEGAGHMVHMEKPSEVNGLINDMLS